MTFLTPLAFCGARVKRSGPRRGVKVKPTMSRAIMRKLLNEEAWLKLARAEIKQWRVAKKVP